MVAAPETPRTALCQLLGCRLPILLAGMGGVSRHRLAAAVSAAGGFGVLGMVREPVSRIRAEIAALRNLSQAPFGLNLIPAATPPDLLEQQVQACLSLDVECFVLFWDVDHKLVQRLKGEGCRVIHQIGSRDDARAALDAGVDALILQGHEAGGHVRAERPWREMLPDVIAISDVPVAVSGGIGHGRDIADALSRGAAGVSLGTALLTTEESNAHSHHKQRVVAAAATDTVHTMRFQRNWLTPAPVRVLRNRVTDGLRDGESTDTVIGHQDGEPVYLFSTDSPLQGARGELDDMALYAGSSCGDIDDILATEQRLEHLLQQMDISLGRDPYPG